MEKTELQPMVVFSVSFLLSGAARCRMSYSPQDFDDPMEVDLSTDHSEPAQLNLALSRSDSAFDAYHHRSLGITMGAAARFQVRFLIPSSFHILFSIYIYIYIYFPLFIGEHINTRAQEQKIKNALDGCIL
jgi:hypothetical protein